MGSVSKHLREETDAQVPAWSDVQQLDLTHVILDTTVQQGPGSVFPFNEADCLGVGKQRQNTDHCMELAQKKALEGGPPQWMERPGKA